MNMPAGYNEATVNNYETLEPGGHRCVIKAVQEAVSQNGNKILIIQFDTDQGDRQPMFYMNQYMAEKERRQDAPWRGVHRLLVDERSDFGIINLKKFNTSVEDSNEGFVTQWGDAYCRQFEGVKVGIVFRIEDYTKEDGSAGASVKPYYFCDYAKALDQKVPKRKEQAAPKQDLNQQYQQWSQQQQPQQQWNPQPQQPQQNAWANAPVDQNGHWVQPQPQYQQATMQQMFQQPPMAQAANEGFMRIPPDALEDEGLPFK